MSRLLQLVNTEAGRYLLGIKDKKKVAIVTPNSHHLSEGKTFKATFYTSDIVANLFSPILAKMDIAEEHSYKAFLHHSGLEMSPKYSHVFLSESTFNTHTGDAYLKSASTTSWAAARAGDTLSKFDNTELHANADHAGSTWTIRRIFSNFNTAALPDSAVISAVNYKLYVSAKTNGDNDGADYVRIVTNSSASDTSVETTDWGNITTTAQSDTDFDIGSITTSAYNTWPLNSAGLASISKTGYTKFGAREGHDISNASIADNTDNDMNANSVTGANAPQLVVTYTVAGGNPMFFSSGGVTVG